MGRRDPRGSRGRALSGLRRGVARLLLPIDTWERHTIVARLAGEAATVLDVGGVSGQLRLFLPRARIVALNVEEPADILFGGRTLPFGDTSFDVVTSLDVLEHLPRGDRAPHLRELARVARRSVVLCCPLGSAEHVAAERELAEWYVSVTGGRHRFLEEHLERGLPTESELCELAGRIPGYRFTMQFHGDFRTVNGLFKLGVLARSRARPRDLAAYARRRVGARAEPELDLAPNPHTNRAFLVGERIARESEPAVAAAVSP